MPAFEGKADTTAPFPTDIVFFYMSPDRLALCNWLWLPNWSEKFQVQALRKSRSRSKSPASIDQYPAWPPWTRHKSANDTAASIKSGRHNVARSTPTPAPPSPAGTYPAGSPANSPTGTPSAAPTPTTAPTSVPGRGRGWCQARRAERSHGNGHKQEFAQHGSLLVRVAPASRIGAGTACG